MHESLGILGYSNIALVVANIACLLSFAWVRRRVKYYDRSIRTLEEEQGEWYVNFVVERELAKLFKHYTDGGKTDDEDDDEDDDEYEDVDDDEYEDIDDEDEDEDDDEDEDEDEEEDDDDDDDEDDDDNDDDENDDDDDDDNDDDEGDAKAEEAVSVRLIARRGVTYMMVPVRTASRKAKKTRHRAVMPSGAVTPSGAATPSGSVTLSGAATPSDTASPS
jgi:hypothetical protein